jgi:C4-type Zn-finger protein
MSFDERHIKELVLTTVTKCGSCGHTYALDNISILGHEDELWFLMLVCDDCSSRGLIAAMIKEQKRHSQISAEVTDLDAAKITARVGVDDVLTIREFLKEFDGDFVALFGKKESDR